MIYVYIWGTQGHSKVIFDIIKDNQDYTVCGFIDDNKSSNEFLGQNIYRPEELNPSKPLSVVIAIGDNATRSHVVKNANSRFKKISFLSVISKKAHISSDLKIKEGSVIMPGATINAGSKIGKHTIVNTNATIDHDCELMDFSSIAPSATLGGTCSIGKLSSIGINATILHNIKIGYNTIIGAGSVVTKNMSNNIVAYGVPCKEIRSRKVGEKYL